MKRFDGFVLKMIQRPKFWLGFQVKNRILQLKLKMASKMAAKTEIFQIYLMSKVQVFNLIHFPSYLIKEAKSATMNIFRFFLNFRIKLCFRNKSVHYS